MTEGREDKRKGRREEHNALKRKIISISITRRLLNLAVAVTAACGERQREREQRGGWSEGDRDTLVQSGRGRGRPLHRTFNVNINLGSELSVRKICSGENAFLPMRRREGKERERRMGGREGIAGK